MARVPAFAKVFAGRRCIIEVNVWNNDFLDLVEGAHLTFEGVEGGEIAFGTLKGFVDVRYGVRDGAACAEFSWEGYDDKDPACGRGWVTRGTAGRVSVTSTSTRTMTQASSANLNDFFNSPARRDSAVSGGYPLNACDLVQPRRGAEFHDSVLVVRRPTMTGGDLGKSVHVAKAEAHRDRHT